MEPQTAPAGWSRLWVDGASAYSPRESIPTECTAQRARSANQSWYRINALAESAEIYIYDEIGFFGVTAKDFAQEISGLSQPQLDIHLNTPGGDVFDGIAIYNLLKGYSGQVNIFIDSLAASIGSVIAMAGDHITIANTARLMMHEAWALTIGNASDMAKMAERLNSTSDIIAGIYAERAGGTPTEWRAKMAEESWFTGQQAVDAGLADDVAAPAKAQKAAFTNATSFRPGLIAARLMEPEVDEAIPYGDHGKAPEGASWSAPTLSDFTDQTWDELSDAEKRRIAAHYVWTDSGDPPASFGDLAGPHHQPSKDGIGPAVWDAVSSGRMAQASWYDNPGVRSHLAGHYRQFDKTPPWESSNKAPAPIRNAGRTMSQANLNKMHDSMQQMSDVHAAVCDMGADCPLMPDEAEPVAASSIVIEAHVVSPERQKTLAEIDARMASGR